MSPTTLVDLIAANGALGLACLAIITLSGVVAHLYRALERSRDAHTTYLVDAVARQIESDRRVAAALDGVRDAITLALTARGDR